MNEFDKFYGNIWQVGSGSLVITIPAKLIEFTGIKEGDLLEIMIKKAKQKESEDNKNDNT